MSPTAAMLALLIETGTCGVKLPPYWIGQQKVIELRCNDERPDMQRPGPYRVPGHDRG
jgi:hypothetical protein